jgi:DNA repair protein RadC
VVLAHNHPHGRPIASSEDLDTTARVRNFLLEMNVVMIDHFIVAEEHFSSVQKEEYHYLYKDQYRNLSEPMEEE